MAFNLLVHWSQKRFLDAAHLCCTAHKHSVVYFKQFFKIIFEMLSFLPDCVFLFRTDAAVFSVFSTLPVGQPLNLLALYTLHGHGDHSFFNAAALLLISILHTYNGSNSI